MTKKLEIMIGFWPQGGPRYVAVTSDKDSNNELTSFAGPVLTDVTSNAIDYAIEQGYSGVNIKTAKDGKEFEDFIVRHLAA